MTKQRILIVDDEPDIRELLEITLLRMGLETRSAESYRSAIAQLQAEDFHLCLTDMRLEDGDGIALVEYIQQHCPDTPVAVITAHGSIDWAIKAMKAGAFDFVSKPVSLATLRNLVDKALTLPRVNEPTLQSIESQHQIIGNSSAMIALRKNIAKFARSQAPIFISGESGTGKELVARQIHLQGARANAAFIAVNCGAIPSELMESELFGHLKGSFTNASRDNPGLFKSAQAGTLFLDEIADLPLLMQVKLLRVIQEKTVRAVGAQTEESIDVRIISASHRDLEAMVRAGSFRQDLYYRINVIGIHVPPLREHPDDIPELARHMINQNSDAGTPKPEISQAAFAALARHPFPGNVRELENILQRASALSEGAQIDRDDLQLPPPIQPDADWAMQAQAVEKHRILQMLEQHRWNQSATARTLGITLRQLRYKIKKLNLGKR